MKRLSKLLMAAVAASMMMAPVVADAQPRQDHRSGHHYSQGKKPELQKRAPSQHRWSKGQRHSNWQRAQRVRDHDRYGLRRPGQGQQWVKVGNDYLLVSVLNGLIVSIIAGR